MKLLAWRKESVSLTQQIKQLTRSLDLTEQFPHDDELSRAMGDLLGVLHGKIAESVAATVGIAAQAPALSTIARETAETGRELAQSSENIASSSEEVTTTLERELVPRANDVAALSNKVAEAIRSCETGSGEVLQNIDAISSAEKHLATAIKSLEAQLEEVIRVIGVISSISKQTNLLALNAAIEAARAGVHGRGFAVVAEEVRDLAGHTTDATDQVSAIIDKFKSDVSGLQQAGGQMEVAVEDGENGVRNMRKELHTVSSAMGELDVKVSDIAHSTNEMSSAMNMVNRDVQTVSRVASDMQSKAVQVGELSSAVHKQSDRLLEGIGGFTLKIHKLAQQVMVGVAKESSLISGNMSMAEQTLRTVLERDSRFELLYLVGSDGIQISENIFADQEYMSEASSARGKNWRQREWFSAVIDSGQPYITPLYRSAATDDFCFTVSVPVFNSDGQLVRVLGGDVRLSSLV
ncbi:MAG: methyl-accepting chemotaxis protein [Pseudohongiellaceae bacterium]|nr:methyl-accepting chemotaxis protein [Pseudohongiellaceae bacterium]